jgi:hypothetical protein
MSSVNEAKAVKRQKLIDRATGKSDEPIIDIESNKPYMTQFMSALNWYSGEADSKQRKAWALAYFKKQKQLDTAEYLSELPDWDFHSLGVLLRMKSRGSFLSQKEEDYIGSRTEELLNKPQPKKVVVVQNTPVVPVVSIQDRILEKSHEFGGEIDGQIDDFIEAGCPANFKIPMRGISAPVAKHIAAFYQPVLEELQETLAGEDEQLVEGYSNFTKPQLKRYIALIESIIANCEQAKKVVRKPRVRKAKPAGEIVKNMKFKKEDNELGIKSIVAATIVGSSELWVYNTKYRKLQVYRAVDGGLLTVKGTSILNYDTKTSGSKTLRKPEEQLKSMLDMTKRPINTAYKAIKGKEAVPNGRINEECILFKVYS